MLPKQQPPSRNLLCTPISLAARQEESKPQQGHANLDISPAALEVPASRLHRLPQQDPGDVKEPSTQHPNFCGPPHPRQPHRLRRALRPVVRPDGVQDLRDAQELPEASGLRLHTDSLWTALCVMRRGPRTAHRLDGPLDTSLQFMNMPLVLISPFLSDITEQAIVKMEMPFANVSLKYLLKQSAGHRTVIQPLSLLWNACPLIDVSCLTAGIHFHTNGINYASEKPSFSVSSSGPE